MSYGQNNGCNCVEDFKFLNEKIKKTPAYKLNKNLYNSAYEKLSKDVTSSTSLFDCHFLMNKLLLSLNDNHSRVYGLDLGAISDVKKDAEKFKAFKKSVLFSAYSKPNLNLDSLKMELSSKAKTDIEGIYKRDNYMTLGLYKISDRYQAIILKSETEVWQEGEIIYNFIPYGKNYLLGIGGSMVSKRLIAYTERIENGIFYFMGFQKDTNEKNYARETRSDSIYFREEISNDITYLKVGSFNSWNPTLSKAEKFYKALEGTLNKKHLIVDLRNNGGGGERNSNILYKQLKQYAKNNNIYVLMNHRTMSNAEQFAYRLRQLKNCKLFGMRTNGTLAFEIKDSSYDLPCKQFRAVLTAKKHSTYLDFESKGILPDEILNIHKDWVDQLKDLIIASN